MGRNTNATINKSGGHFEKMAVFPLPVNVDEGSYPNFDWGPERDLHANFGPFIRSVTVM